MGGIRWTAVKLGIFTSVTVVVTVWLAAVIGNFQLFASPYEIEAEFSDATGLLRGDVVKAAGVTVGRVEEIVIDDGIALVTMSINEGTELPANLRAQIRFRNLIGQRMITLLPAEEEGTGEGLVSDELAEGGDLIPLDRTDPAFDLTSLFNGLRPVIRSTSPADINLVTNALTEALRGRSDDVEALLGNVADISETLAGKDRELSVLLKNLNLVTSDLAGRDAQLRGTLADLNDFLASVDASKDDLAAALTTLDIAARKLDRIVEANDANIKAEVDALAVLLDAVDDKRADLRGALRALPDVLVGTERVHSYGEWMMIHLVDICKDDSGTCGARGTP
jgi:phospholipid/cholesterol/gamma-HCH transport system substrate-binding protein